MKFLKNLAIGRNLLIFLYVLYAIRQNIKEDQICRVKFVKEVQAIYMVIYNHMLQQTFLNTL
jgi:hypothetical protein